MVKGLNNQWCIIIPSSKRKKFKFIYLLLAIIIQILNADQETITESNNNEVTTAEQQQQPTVPIEILEEQQPIIPLEVESVLSNLKDPYVPKQDTPLFWHIPKSGGTSIKNMYSQCYNMVEASESGGVVNINNADPIIKVVNVEDGRYVNVDVTLEAGIDHAAKMQLIESNLADIIVSPLFYKSTTTLFSPARKGRLMAVFREPIERVVSLFYYLQKATWEPTYNKMYQNMTLEQFAFSPYCESNFVGRSLLNKMEAALTVTDIQISKMILSEKCLIGLLSNLPTSVQRFDDYFGFSKNFNVDCQDEYVKKGVNRHSHVSPTTDNNNIIDESQRIAYEEIKRKNWFDIILYQYAIELFQKQGDDFFMSKDKEKTDNSINGDGNFALETSRSFLRS